MYDFSNNNASFSPVASGDYEVIIDNAEFKQSKNGKNFIGIKFLIRQDVDQKFGGRYLFDNIWEDDVFYDKDGKVVNKDEYEKLPVERKSDIVVRREYKRYKIIKLVNAQDCDAKIKDAEGNTIDNPNYVTKFEDLDEVLQFLNQMPLIVNVSTYFDNRTGEEKNMIEYKGVKRTKHPLNATLAVTDSSQPDSLVASEEIDEDDLPF